MRWFRKTPNFDYLAWRKLWLGISIVLILGSLVSLFTRGLDLGLDFTGGTVIEVGYSQPAELGSVRDALSEAGYPDAVVQHFGTSRDVLVRIPPRESVTSAQLGDEVVKVLNSASEESVNLRRQEYVGPQVGEEIRDDGGLAVLFALIGILIYVAFRFEYRFSLGAVAALIHDVIITLGLFSVLQVSFDLTVLAAILAVIGYSLNDTIVIYDRIRENFRKMRKATTVEVINTSLNQTLSRTIVTGLTTLLVLLALFFLGGELIRGFALALIAGVIIGTYSSIYVASSLVLAMGVSRAQLLPVEKEGVREDAAN